MTKETLISILVGMPITVILGLYASRIHSRYSKFNSKKDEVLRIIRGIDYIEENQGLRISNDSDLRKLPLIASELYSLGQAEAANTINKISSDIHEVSMHGRTGRLNSNSYGISFKLWQKEIRDLSCNQIVIWKFWK